MINTWYQALKCYHNRCYQCIVVIEPSRVLLPFYELLMADFMLASPCAMRKALARSGSPSALKGTCVRGLPAFGLVVRPYGSSGSCGLGAAVNVSPRALEFFAADPFGLRPSGTASKNSSALRPSLRSVRTRSLDFVTNYF